MRGQRGRTYGLTASFHNPGAHVAGAPHLVGDGQRAIHPCPGGETANGRMAVGADLMARLNFVFNARNKLHFNWQTPRIKHGQHQACASG